jgi:hypothetical protein
MRLRSQRRNLLLSDLAAPVGKSRATRLVRPRRIRWWLRTGAWLSVIGTRRFARTARTRWPPIFLFIGTLVLVIGLMLRSSVAFVSGMLVAGPLRLTWGCTAPRLLPFARGCGYIRTGLITGKWSRLVSPARGPDVDHSP